jgi:quinol monooxygenase YgiN
VSARVVKGRSKIKINDSIDLISLIMKKHAIKTTLLLVLSLGLVQKGFAQEKKQMVRLAKIVIDSAQIETYNAFLKEEIETSMRVEKGVLLLYAVSEQKKPTHITILEIFANVDAFQSHIKTPHFLKYKTATKDMIKSLEVLEADPLVPGMKVK